MIQPPGDLEKNLVILEKFQICQTLSCPLSEKPKLTLVRLRTKSFVLARASLFVASYVRNVIIYLFQPRVDFKVEMSFNQAIDRIELIITSIITIITLRHLNNYRRTISSAYGSYQAGRKVS